MKLWQVLCLLGFGFLLLAQLPLVKTDGDDDFEDEEEETFIESEKEDIRIPRERPVYTRPVLSDRAHFAEPFDTRAEYLRRWIPSQAKKDGVDESVAKYDGKWEVEEPKDNPVEGDLGLVLKSKAKHHAVSAKLDRPYEFSGKPFFVQYEVKFQNGMDCGGAYIKLLAADKLNLKTFTDKTPYTIMFGPDKCGNDQKLHFIFRHRNPKTGEYEEKHAEKTSAKLDSYFTDKNTHLFTLIVNPDNSYEVKVDNSVVSSGDLLTNMSPPVNPPKEIDDPNDKKPSDWDDREKIPDPDATKPEDWDESEPATIVDESAEMPAGWLEDEESYIPDPEAVKPEDWDDEMDGEWEAPKIDNPECTSAPGCGKWERPTMANPNYKGKWKAPMVDNPEYKGAWKARRIENPDYFEDKHPYKMTPIAAVGLELWSMTDDILFDNFIVTDNLTLLDEFTALTWEVKSLEEKAATSTGQSIIQAIKDATNERPWLWAVFILVVVLPIILIITYCCSSGGNAKPDDIDAHRKKFDDPTPDDEEGEDGEKEEGEAEIDEGATGDREMEESKEEEAEEVGAAGDGATDQDGEDNEEAGPDASSKKSNSPRKRRARKE